MVGRPDSQVGVFGILADENNLRQTGFCLPTVVIRLIKCASGNTEISGVAVDGTTRPEIAACATEVRHLEKIPAHSQIQRKVRPHLPIVFKEPVEFVLVVLADFSSCSVRLTR